MQQAILIPVAWQLLCPHCRKNFLNPDGQRTWVAEDVQLVADDTLVCVCGQPCST